MKRLKFLFVINFLFSAALHAREYLVELSEESLSSFKSQASVVDTFDVIKKFKAFGKTYIVLKEKTIHKDVRLRSVSFVVSQLQQMGANHAELNQEIFLFAGSPPPHRPDEFNDFTPRPVLPNDKEFVRQWGMLNFGQKIGINDGIRKFDASVAQAWNYFRGHQNFVVGVMDSGIEYRHNDLKDNLWRAYDNNGKPYYGFDAFDGDNDVRDWSGHGTHVAGIIGARGNNDRGVSGVNWHVSLASVKVFSDRGVSQLDAVIRGLSWLYDKRNTIKVVNHSWGMLFYSGIMDVSFKKLDQAGVINVIAAGNSGMPLGDPLKGEYTSIYPAMFKLENSIVVAAHDNRGERASFSNYSETYVDIVAPGEDIYSTTRDGFYGLASGTSMAAPHVAGAVALLWGSRPSLSAHQVKRKILDSAEYSSSLKGVARGAKRLNVLKLFK